MGLADYRRPDSDLTRRLETVAVHIVGLINTSNDSPSVAEMKQAKDFLILVEYWKADCMEEQTGAAVRNAPSEVWDALCGAVFSRNDIGKLRSIMNLVGFGSSRDPDTGQRRAKRATAVMRFLDPQLWGTVDWRTIAMMSYYKQNSRDMVNALKAARRMRKGDVASLFDFINENGALQTVEAYRALRDSDSPRTVDVELAFYGASFLAWPRPS